MTVAERLKSRRVANGQTSAQLSVGFAGARLGRSTDMGAAPPVPVPAAVAGEGSVDVSEDMAGFPGRSGGRPRPRTVRPAALRYPLAVSRRTPVAPSIRRNDQPRRPSARTCCRFSSAKTLLVMGRNTQFQTGVNVLGRYPKWPVFKRPLMAGFSYSLSSTYHYHYILWWGRDHRVT